VSPLYCTIHGSDGAETTKDQPTAPHRLLISTPPSGLRLFLSFPPSPNAKAAEQRNAKQSKARKGKGFSCNWVFMGQLHLSIYLSIHPSTHLRSIYPPINQSINHCCSIVAIQSLGSLAPSFFWLRDFLPASLACFVFPCPGRRQPAQHGQYSTNSVVIGEGQQVLSVLYSTYFYFVQAKHMANHEALTSAEETANDHQDGKQARKRGDMNRKPQIQHHILQCMYCTAQITSMYVHFL